VSPSDHPSGALQPDPLEIGPWWLPLWAETVSQPAHQVDLTRAALFLSAHGSSYIRSIHDVGVALENIDRLMAMATTPHAGNSSFEAWHRLCFTTLGLHGDQTNYHDPRNSYLPDIMRRRVGLPIGLAVLSIELGQRLGVDCWGVGMPGHFLLGARRSIGGEEVYVDVFDGGTIVDAQACETMFDRMLGPDRQWSGTELSPTDNLAMLIRMLTNLKQHAARRRDLITLCDLARLRWFLPGLQLEEGRELVRLCAAIGAHDEAPGWMSRLVRRFGSYEGYETDHRIISAALN
jgi:Transglutaminase-like superfamily